MRTFYSHLNVGRNDPCLCGSGKKFKKCCIDKPWEASPELEADLALGQRLIAEYEAEQKASILRDKLTTDGFSLKLVPIHRLRIHKSITRVLHEKTERISG
jgi:hypothetical protein